MLTNAAGRFILDPRQPRAPFRLMRAAVLVALGSPGGLAGVRAGEREAMRGSPPRGSVSTAV